MSELSHLEAHTMSSDGRRSTNVASSASVNIDIIASQLYATYD